MWCAIPCLGGLLGHGTAVRGGVCLGIDWQTAEKAGAAAMIIAAIVLLVVLALMGAPLFAIILGAAALGFYTLEIELAVLHIDIYQLSNSVVLMALPLFTFAGFLLSESKTADRMLRLSQAMLDRLNGILAKQRDGQ